MTEECVVCRMMLDCFRGGTNKILDQHEKRNSYLIEGRREDRVVQRTSNVSPNKYSGTCSHRGAPIGKLDQSAGYKGRPATQHL
jgi:hypothetical protein